MEVTSFVFLGVAFAVTLSMNVVTSLAGRRYILLAANLLFLAGLAAPIELVPTALFLVLGYALLMVQYRWSYRHSLAIAVASVVLVFAVLKRYAILSYIPSLPLRYSVVGLSYLLFRLVHLLVDVRQKAITRLPSPLQYANYMCFFPSFLSGPIQRFQDFEAQELASAQYQQTREGVERVLRRIVLGYLKVLVVCGLLMRTHYFPAEFLTWTQSAANPLTTAWIIRFAVACSVYIVFLYLNFSGYMDIVLGLAALFGFNLPENFDQPFRSTNFLDLWSRWHITLSNWFRFYVFNSLLRHLARRHPSPGLLPYLGVLAFFVTFVLMGLWHGTTPIYLVYGLLLGLGVSANKLFQLYLQQKMGKRTYEQWRQRRPVQLLARGLTISYFAVALTCLWADGNLAATIATWKGVAAALAAWMLVWILVCVLLPMLDVAREVLTASKAANWIQATGALRMVATAAELWIVFAATLILQNQVTFVYRAF